MSALEYTIHHYTEIHKKLRNAKGQVLLQNEHGGVVPVASAPAAAVKSGAHSIVLNGFHGSLAATAVGGVVDVGEVINKRPCDGAATNSSSIIAAFTSCNSSSSSSSSSRNSGADYATAEVAASSPRPEQDVATSVTSAVDDASESACEESCSRTCPLLRSKFRRRNVIRLDSWHGTAANGRQFASVRCDCVPPVRCVLCVRRGPGADLSSQHVYANLLPVQSKIALLEPTYHPVLSFPSGEYDQLFSYFLCVLVCLCVCAAVEIKYERVNG